MGYSVRVLSRRHELTGGKTATLVTRCEITRLFCSNGEWKFKSELFVGRAATRILLKIRLCYWSRIGMVVSVFWVSCSATLCNHLGLGIGP